MFCPIQRKRNQCLCKKISFKFYSMQKKTNLSLFQCNASAMSVQKLDFKVLFNAKSNFKFCSMECKCNVLQKVDFKFYSMQMQ